MKSVAKSLSLIGLVGSLAALLVLAQALWSFDAFNASAQRALVAKDVVADILPPPLYLVEMRLVLSQAVEQTLPLQQAHKEFERLAAEYRSRTEHWTSYPPFGLEKLLLGPQHAAAQAFMANARTEVLSRLNTGDAAAARAALQKAHELYLAHRSAVDASVKASSDVADESMASFASERRQGMARMIGLTLTLVGLTAALVVHARKAILAPLRVCLEQANTVAAGDLSQRIAAERSDDFGALQRALSHMAQELSRMVAEVRDGTLGLTQTSEQISRGNSALAGRTDTQYSSVQQAVASMQCMSQSVRESVDDAQAANELAQQASALTADFGAAVGRLVLTMGDIRGSSTRIENIIGVIDSIAFQTNILALNAAVEAARAGEQGRGFAVVAAEVRGLATRSAEAAREIKGLILSSAQKIESGHQIATKAGQSVEQVVGQVQEVTALMSRICAASQTQRQGVDQLNQAVQRLDSAAQENASLVQDTSMAADKLREQAERLNRAVASFRL